MRKQSALDRIRSLDERLKREREDLKGCVIYKISRTTSPVGFEYEFRKPK